MKEKDIRDQVLFLNWLLKHYTTQTDEEGFFYYADAQGKEVSMLSIVTHYTNRYND